MDYIYGLELSTDVGGAPSNNAWRAPPTPPPHDSPSPPPPTTTHVDLLTAARVHVNILPPSIGSPARCQISSNQSRGALEHEAV